MRRGSNGDTTLNAMSRRLFMTTAAAGSAAIALGTGTGNAEAQLVYTKTDWDVAEFEKLVRDPAHAKQVYDVTQVGGGKFLNNIKNSINGLHFGFGIADNNIKIVAALHGPANMLAYDDALWAKYKLGAWLKVNDPATGQPATRNPYLIGKTNSQSMDPDDRQGFLQETAISALQHRGVKFMSCHTALEEQASALVKHNNLSMQAEDLAHDMMAHALPGVLIVASMVAAIALLQIDGHYSYITV